MWSKMEDQEISSDYEYGDEWDWDREDPNQYCRHGSFIGSWWGPDILCMNCEIDEDPTLNEMIRPFDKKVEDVEKYIQYLKDIILHTIEIIDNDLDGYRFLSDFNLVIEKMMKDYEVRKVSLINQKDKLYNKYIEHCEDPDNDRDILYKAHRKELREYKEMVKNGNHGS